MPALAAPALVALVLLFALAPAASASDSPQGLPGTKPVMFIGNTWDGTADIVDPVTFKVLRRLNVVPDLQERLREIYFNPVRLGYFTAIRQLVGEGHDQYADDIFSSADGLTVYVSRPSLADVVGIDLRTQKIIWRVPMEGQRADHMAVSPDGNRLLVSDSTANLVQVIDPKAGRKVAEFPSGDSPHESNYSKDGSRIFHASIGLVYTPADQPVADSTKGERFFQIVDARTLQITKRLDIGKILAAHGYPDYSSAVRPMAISPDEKTAYFQLSFLHGFVEFDLENDRPLRIATLPISEEARATPRENYLLDSAHHGLAINPEGTKLCAAGTMSDYAAIVSRATFAHTVIDVGPKPYWSTNSGDGRYCFVSVSGSDEVVVIDYASEKEIARIKVGDHPQRMRMGSIAGEAVAALPASTASGVRPKGFAKLRVLRARVRGGRLEMRLRMTSKAARGRVRASYLAAGRRTRFSVAVPRRTRGRDLVTWTATRRLRGAQRGARSGLLDLAYDGGPAVEPDTARVRVNGAPARLRRVASAIGSDGRLDVSGTVSRRARGSVLVRLHHFGDPTRAQVLTYRAPVRGGRWRVRELLPSRAARVGGMLSIQYAGDLRRRVRGEQTGALLRP